MLKVKAYSQRLHCLLCASKASARFFHAGCYCNALALLPASASLPRFSSLTRTSSRRSDAKSWCSCLFAVSKGSVTRPYSDVSVPLHSFYRHAGPVCAPRHRAAQPLLPQRLPRPHSLKGAFRPPLYRAALRTPLERRSPCLRAPLPCRPPALPVRPALPAAGPAAVREPRIESGRFLPSRHSLRSSVTPCCAVRWESKAEPQRSGAASACEERLPARPRHLDCQPPPSLFKMAPGVSDMSSHVVSR